MQIWRYSKNLPCNNVLNITSTIRKFLFFVGQNNCGQIGSGTTTNQSTPRKVFATFGGKRVIFFYETCVIKQIIASNRRELDIFISNLYVFGYFNVRLYQ